MKNRLSSQPVCYHYKCKTRCHYMEALPKVELDNVCLNNRECDGDYVVLFGRVNFGTWSCNMNAMCMGL